MNLIVLSSLQLINPSLPQLVKQRYGTELIVRKLASIKPEISHAIPSFLEKIRDNEDAISFRTFAKPHHSRGSLVHHHPGKQQSRSCPRSSAHFLSKCRFVPECDRKYNIVSKS